MSIQKSLTLLKTLSMDVRNQTDFPAEGLTIESLMEALFYRDEFLSIASHELKTPLTSLKLQAQVFKRHSKKNETDIYSKEKIDRLVDQIDLQTTRLVKLVDVMLDISRIRSGKLTMTKERFNLSEVVKSITSSFILERSAGQNISVKVSKDIFYHGDKSRIEQVIVNILNNALSYGKGRPIEVRLIKRKSKISLSIADQGMGISREDQKRIFHRFQRAVPASEVSGLGLGLYIANEIVTSHGGKISVKSEIDAGSTFTVELRSEETT